jgi:hypothetical protein
MITGADVLTMLIPNGGWVISGDEFDGIQFLECEAISEKEFKDGFAKFAKWKADQETAKNSAKAALLERLGITSDEAALLLK